MSDWISVKERLPENDCCVLCVSVSAEGVKRIGIRFFTRNALKPNGDFLLDQESRFNLIDELADVIIMVEQISYLMSVRGRVVGRIGFKLNRQLERIAAEVNDEHSDN